MGGGYYISRSKSTVDTTKMGLIAPQFPGNPNYLRGIVDMGSNGIRFSISDLSPPTTRILPTLHVHRLDVSLYDTQFDPDTGNKIPIPQDVIEYIIAALVRFQIICSDFGVPEHQIRIIATEATRTAVNMKDFVQQIKDSTGLIVEMLPKEVEGKVGAFGVASGFSKVRGIVMDLGGGSAQITWMIAESGEIKTSPLGSFSFPYGAAALSRRLSQITKGKSKEEARRAKAKLREEMTANFSDAFEHLQIPGELVDEAKENGGYHLYLTGGGFRGWGYLLLYQHQVHGWHYPISLINGFSAQKDQFEGIGVIKEIARTAEKIFRVSDRRRSQVPAVAFLIDALADSTPYGIKVAHFCQGGVREGLLFQELTPRIRREDPLEVATSPYMRQSSGLIRDLLLSAIPRSSSNCSSRFPQSISSHIIGSLANILYVHSIMSKESSSKSALYSTSTGLMSTSHGVSHTDRALLALILEESYEGELPPREAQFKYNLRRVVTDEEAWWTQYVGKVGLLTRRLYPAGYVDERKPRVDFAADWIVGSSGGKDKDVLRLTIYVQRKSNDPMKLKEVLEENKGVIEKVGKRKRWVGGYGILVKVVVQEKDNL